MIAFKNQLVGLVSVGWRTQVDPTPATIKKLTCSTQVSFFLFDNDLIMEKPTFIVYALYSPDYEKIYIGYSSDFEKRLISHNEKATKGWTIRYRPGRVVFTEEFSTQKEAMQRE